MDLDYRIEKLEEYQVNAAAMAVEFDLYCMEDWKTQGVEEGYFLYGEDEDIIGFLLTNLDNQAVAIEIKEEYQGKGLATVLLQAARCYQPERNENPSFWEAVQKKLEED